MQSKSINKSNPTDYGALCFWSWNDNIENEELKRQLEDFSKGRFKGVVIHSRAGLRIPYMGEEWFEAFKFTVKEAKKLGLEVWIYDEDGWPSGFAGGQVTALGEKHWLKRLMFSETDTGILSNRIAAWRKTENGYKSIEKNSAKTGDLICWYTVDSNYVDLLSYETVSYFISKTHERYKTELGNDFGSVVKGIFTDEPQISAYPWSFTLEKAWNDRFGTTLTDNLYLLVKEEDGYEEFRLRFRNFISDLFYNSFTKQIYKWCDENGLALTGHFAEEDGLAMQTNGNCGVTRHYVSMQLPGIDYLGNRSLSPILMKQPSSVANQLGKHGVLSETYGCAGWEISFERICSIWGRQSVLGITKPCFHLSAYSIAGRRKRDYPAFYSYQEPWWDQFPSVMKWINGLNSLMSEGRRMVDVLVISPLGAVMANYGTETALNISADYRCLIENLLSAQVDVELGDENVIAEFGHIDSNKFCIGQSEYCTVIVPEAAFLAENTVKLLRDFANNGGRVIYCGNSTCHKQFKKLDMPNGDFIQNRRKIIESYISNIAYNRPVALYSENDCKLIHEILTHTRIVEGRYRSHIWTDPELKTQKVKVSFFAPNGENTVCLIDVADNKRTLLPCERDGDYLVVFFDLRGENNYVFEWYKSNDKANEVEYSFCKSYSVDNCTVELDADNSLTLDYAEISVNGGDYSKKQPIVRVLKDLYKEREKHSLSVGLPISFRYSFKCSNELELAGISAVIESEHVCKIEVNGKVLKSDALGYWVDKKFCEYDIGQYLHSGNNTVVLYYEFPPSLKGTETDGFETERNRFFFPVEPESIYIKGNFDVSTTAKILNKGNCYRVGENEFELVPSTEKHLGDITKQNAWYYRGNVDYCFNISCQPNVYRYVLALEKSNGVAAEVIVGNKKYMMLSLNEKIDISNAVIEGENKVTVRLLGHNRNLLGPHHHIKGVPAIVGPDTFEGRFGFEDFVSPDIDSKSETWDNGYYFVPFGCEEIKIIEYKTNKID